MAAMTPVGLVLALAALATASQPTLQTKLGHVYITTGESTQNVTDLLSITKAGPLFRDQEGKLNELKNSVTGQVRNVERRSTNNTKTVADLLDELTKTGKSTDAGITALVGEVKAVVGEVKAVVGQVKRLADAADVEKTNSGGGTATKAGGAAFNPFTASVASLGGDRLRVTFPKGAELIAVPTVKMYQCKFTYLKDKKLDSTKTKTSEAVAADSERTFLCVVPAWADKGKMPDEPNFTTNFEVLENGRTMPAPSGGQVIKWTPQIPSLTFADSSLSTSAQAGKAHTVSVDLSIQYQYGEVGYKDVRFSAATDKAWGSIITQIKFSGDASSEKRKMQFTITHPKSAKKEAAYWIDVTIASAKFKLSTKHRLKVNFKATTSIGPGGENGVLTGDQMTQLYQKMGSTKLELCYNPKVHGYNSNTMHSRCDNKGKTFLLMRRPDNGRVFGGWVGQNLNQNTRWVHGNPSPNPWLWFLNPSSKKVAFVPYRTGRSHVYYMHPGYSMTWGGGHDLYCNSALTGCHSNPYSFHLSNNRQLAGTANWNLRNTAGKAFSSVYEVYLIK